MPPHPAQRILICLHDFAMGGTERIAIEMARSWVEAGRDVSILCGAEDGPQRDAVDSRIDVVQLDPPIKRTPLSRLALGRAMGRALPALAPDAIFLPGNYHLFLANDLRTAARRPAIVLKISNPPFPDHVDGPLARAMFRHFTRGVDVLAPMNDSLAVALRRIVPGKTITTRHDPVYIKAGAGEKRRPRDRDAPLNILWAGRLEAQKDVPLALRTLRALLRYAPAHLTLLGDGSQYRATERHVATLGLTAHVTLAGHVARVDPYMVDADALLITSRYEGGPAVAAEALALGVPVVSTDCSSFLHDIMTRLEAGLIVPSRDPDDLAHALHATVERGRPDPAALAALVAHLEPGACASAYLACFDAIVRQRII